MILQVHMAVAVLPLLVVPSISTPQGLSFSLETRSSGRQPSGPAALYKAYLKYGIQTPQINKRRAVSFPQASNVTTGSALAVPKNNDVEYLSPIYIGGQRLDLNIDTGSGDLWVLPKVNASGELLEGLSWSVSYADGSGASGLVYANEAAIGGVTASNQAIQIATSCSPAFSVETGDGILGLGFSNANTVQPIRQRTWFENVKASLKAPLFTASLKKNATGSFDFGFLDGRKYVEPLQYISVNSSRGYWEFTAAGYQIGQSAMAEEKFQSIVDTGTTLMLLPPAVVAAYYAQVPGAENNDTEGGFVFPCSSPLPDITLQVANGTALAVPGMLMNRGVSLTPGSIACYGGIQIGSNSLSILGDVFLKSQFVVFNAGSTDFGPKLGFAKQVPSPTDLER